MGEPSVNPETLENAINGDNYDPQTALPAFFLVPGSDVDGSLVGVGVAYLSVCAVRTVLQGEPERRRRRLQS